MPLSQESGLATPDVQTEQDRGITAPAPADPAIPADPLAHWPQLRVIGARPRLRDYLRDVWAWREFATTIAVGQLRSQHQDTVLGQVWHLLNPLLLTGVYYVIFGLGLRAGERGGIDNFLGYLVVGVITFNYTRTAIRTGAKMIVHNRALVQSINFPRALLPLGAMMEETIAHASAILVMWAALLATGETINPAWVMVVPIVAIQLVFNLGAGMLTARLTFHFRDLQQVLPYALRIWFYGSGVLVPLEPILADHPVLLAIYQANPMYAIVDLSRDAFMFGFVDGRSLLTAVVWAFAALVLGFMYFRAAESEYGRV